MNALNDNWVAAGKLSDLPRRGARRVQLGEFKVALFRTADDQVFALEDRCPHSGGPLSQGIVHDSCVTCPLHNWVIALDSGEAQGADQGQVKTFAVKISDGALQLSLSAVPVES